MIVRIYSVRCDACERVLGEFRNRPTPETLKKAGIIGNNSRHFCDQYCWGEWKHNQAEQRYCNLKQNGKINPE